MLPTAVASPPHRRIFERGSFDQTGSINLLHKLANVIVSVEPEPL